MDIDLNSLDLKELKSLQVRVAKAVATYEDRRKREALAQLEEKARELGFTSLSELTGAGPVRKRAALEAKYANPANADDTWSGRGRKPRWFIEAIAAGKTEADLAI
ncbi:H-NS histone family protein [Pseudogemmobacter faecipullorum]|uniref:H-NS histone family protein n=1 Tax=Pseudogemmobacter faecipullorum TaxID=2755041 RepID=A0ABS8CHV1_9RHOB|nr:H-NS histone family protein [Pseudogemmobacter faecipullorum]MCB5408763.1 H-NS histone family protein [Pseudogemmobacter faecipullorum]